MKTGAVVGMGVLCFASCIRTVAAPDGTSGAAPARRQSTKPILHYTFDEVQGNRIKDVSGHGNKGTAFGTEWIQDGVLGGALDFDGVSSHVDSRLTARWENLLDGEHPVTISLWMYRKRFQTGALFVRGSDPNSCLAHFDNPSFNQLRFYFKRGSDPTSIRVYADTFAETNVWQHVAITYDGSGRAAGVSIFKNGLAQVVHVVNDGLDGPVEVEEPLTLGAYRGYGSLNWFFEGSMDEFMIFDRQLTPEEVRQLYQSQAIGVSLLRL